MSCCARCPSYEGPARGLGDAIKSLSDASGISTIVHAVAGEDCGCQKRRERLNRLAPFRKTHPDAS